MCKFIIGEEHLPGRHTRFLIFNFHSMYNPDQIYHFLDFELI